MILLAFGVLFTALLHLVAAIPALKARLKAPLRRIKGILRGA